jgi:hypothetical protein
MNLLTSIVIYKSTKDSSNSVLTITVIIFALTTTILGDFEELAKATIQFISSVLPSVSMEQLGSNWTGFH